MGWKSTYRIAKNTAQQIIISKILKASNTELENILEQFDESDLRNYVVVDQLDAEDLTEPRVIKNITDF